MAKSLCIYYSRTGFSAQVAQFIAAETGAELLEISNGKQYPGAWGYFRAAVLGLRKKLPEVLPATPSMPLNEYDRVYAVAPIWCENICPILRAYLLAHRAELPRDWHLVLTHMSELTYARPAELFEAAMGFPRSGFVSVSSSHAEWRDDISAFLAPTVR